MSFHDIYDSDEQERRPTSSPRCCRFPLTILENDKTLETNHLDQWQSGKKSTGSRVQSFPCLFSDLICPSIVCAKAAKHLKGVALTSHDTSNFIVNLLL